MTTTVVNKGMNPKIVMIAAIVLLTIVAIAAFNAMAVQPKEYLAPSEEIPQIKESPPEVLVSSTDPVQERLQEIATKEYYSLESMMFMIPNDIWAKLSMDDFCSELTFSEPETDALTQKPAVSIHSKTGFYAGPILFLDKNGNEVDIIPSAVVADKKFGLSVNAELAEHKMVTINKVNPFFEERFTYLPG